MDNKVDLTIIESVVLARLLARELLQGPKNISYYVPTIYSIAKKCGISEQELEESVERMKELNKEFSV